MDAMIIVPFLLAIGRAINGAAKAWKNMGPEFEMNWIRFIGSIVILLVIALVAQFGMATLGMVDTLMLILGQIGFGWIGTNIIEDVIQGKNGE